MAEDLEGDTDANGGSSSSSSEIIGSEEKTCAVVGVPDKVGEFDTTIESFGFVSCIPSRPGKLRMGLGVKFPGDLDGTNKWF
jgi:hypothetical protein